MVKIDQWKQMGLGVFVSLLIASDAFAIGGANIGNEVPSARAGGQGYTGVAGQNEDPMVVYSNPGGLSHLKGTQFTTGLTWENLHGEYESDAGAVTKMRSVDVAVPNVAVTHAFMDGKLGTGLAILSPYGLETHWAGDGALRYTATDSRLHLVMISPAASYQVHEKVSVGAGVDYVNVFDASLEEKLPLGGPDSNYRLKGTATNWGFHTGVVVQPTEKHSFGLTYHSKIKLTINGTAQISGAETFETSAFTDIFLPQNIQMGYTYKPTEKWMWSTDAAWYDWFSSRDFNIRYATTDPLGVLKNGAPIAYNFRDAWSVATGINYKHNDKLQLRSGFWYEPWAMPESTFNPAYLDLSRYGLTAGVGYALTPALTLDAAYNAIFFQNRHITNTVTASGTYKDFTNLLALNVSYKF